MSVRVSAPPSGGFVLIPVVPHPPKRHRARRRNPAETGGRDTMHVRYRRLTVIRARSLSPLRLKIRQRFSGRFLWSQRSYYTDYVCVGYYDPKFTTFRSPPTFGGKMPKQHRRLHPPPPSELKRNSNIASSWCLIPRLHWVERGATVRYELSC